MGEVRIGEVMAKRIFNVTKTVGGSKQYRQWKDWKSGDYIVGKYLSQGIDQFKKNNYTFELEDAQFADENLATSLVGKNLCLNACGSLDKQMEHVSTGEYVRVEYTGMALMTKGPFAGKEAHSTILEILEVAGVESEEEDDGL